MSESKTRVLTFFTQETETFEGLHVPRGPGLMQQNLVQSDSRSLLFGAILDRKEAFHVWRDDALSLDDAQVLHSFSDRPEGVFGADRNELAARRILQSNGIELEPGSASLDDAVRTFTDLNSETVTRRRVRFPLLYNYTRSGEDVEWSGPLWLLRSSTKPGDSRFSFLYYAYRSETVGDRTTRDIFPFITWDSGPDEKNISFLWRLLHYQRRGDRRGGHVLFIPFGDL